MPVRRGFIPVKKALRPGRAALLGVVVDKLGALICEAINVGRFAQPHPLLVGTHLHPTDVVTHNEEDVGLLLWLLCGYWCARDYCGSGYRK